MRKDELMRFIHNARTEDFHEGKHRLSFSTYVHHISMDTAGPPPMPGAALVVGEDGAFWLIEQGTPRERRIPMRAGTYTVVVAITDAPKTHLGKTLEKTDPITVCTLALDYLQNLVFEARERFSSTR
jgi:hypothetical protein